MSADISQAVPRAIVDTHLEPLDDPASWADQELGRGAVSVGAPTAREGAV